MTAEPLLLAEMPPSLDGALERLHLDGAIFFRSEFTENWSYQSLPGELIPLLLHPGAKRLVMFHIVATGRCWVALDDGERHWADAGDVIVVPYGEQHSVGGTEDAETVSIAELVEPPPWQTMPVLRYGHGGVRTDIVCGYLHSTDPLFDPALGAFPRVFVARPSEGPAAEWVRSSIEYTLARSEELLPGAATPSTRLPELLVIEILRAHLASAPATRHGWIGAMRDPVLAPALAAMHRDLARHWSLAELAAECSVSRSALDERFRAVLGRSPIRYLTEWRMHIAGERLRSTDLAVARIARDVGYDSDEAFSRAFKRHHGEPPSRWRRPTPGPAC